MEQHLWYRPIVQENEAEEMVLGIRQRNWITQSVPSASGGTWALAPPIRNVRSAQHLDHLSARTRELQGSRALEALHGDSAAVTHLGKRCSRYSSAL